MEFEEEKEKEEERKRQEVVERKEAGASKGLVPIESQGVLGHGVSPWQGKDDGDDQIWKPNDHVTNRSHFPFLFPPLLR